MRAAVLGKPVAHSLSPTLHNAAYHALGLSHEYSAIEVVESELVEFVTNLDSTWLGLSLTMPLKEVAFSITQTCDDLAVKSGAINTLIFANGIHGYNTDVLGIVDAVTENGLINIDTMTIFGSGATARSALLAASNLGAKSVDVVARNVSDSAKLHDLALSLNMDLRVCAVTQSNWLQADLVINTTPVGVLDEIAKEVFKPKGLLLDVVYDPWPTQLAACWSTNGGNVLSGLTMLLHQAGHQITLMTGQPAPLTEMRAALNLELLDRGLSTI